MPLRTSLLRLRSDEQLVALFRGGSEDAFGVIHDRYRTRLLAYTRQMLSSPQDAEDAMQDVFIRAYRALRAGDRAIALKPWLYRVAHNRCIDLLRRPSFPPTDEIEAAAPAALPANDPLSEAERREDLRRLIADVRRLPEQQRSVLLMREMEGLSYQALATTLDTTIPAIKSLLVRARLGLVQAAEARETDCEEIRADLALAAGRGVRTTGRARRHLHDCAECRHYRGELRKVTRRLHALSPVHGGLLALLGLGGGGGAAASAVSGGGGGGASAVAVTGASGAGASAAAVGGAAGASGAGALGGGALAVTATKVAAVVCAAAVTGAGAVTVEHRLGHAPNRPTAHAAAVALTAPSAAPTAAAPAPRTTAAVPVAAHRAPARHAERILSVHPRRHRRLAKDLTTPAPALAPGQLASGAVTGATGATGPTGPTGAGGDAAIDGAAVAPPAGATGSDPAGATTTAPTPSGPTSPAPAPTPAATPASTDGGSRGPRGGGGAHGGSGMAAPGTTDATAPQPTGVHVDLTAPLARAARSISGR